MKLKSASLEKLGKKLRGIKAAHQVRRTSTGYEFALADRISLLNPLLWDAAAGGGGFLMRRSYLQILEEHGPDTLHPVYALISGGGVPLAAVAAQWLDFDGARIQRLSPETTAAASKDAVLKEKWIKPLARKARARIRQRVLVAGNLLSWGCHGVSFAPDTDEASVWPAVAEALYRIRRAAKLEGETDFIAIKDITPRETGHFSLLQQLGYRSVETEPDMILDLNPGWRGFDDYAAALSSKYRKSAKQIREEVIAAGFVVETLTDVSASASRLHELYESVHENAPVRLATLPPRFWSAFAASAGADLRCTVLRRGTEIVGFVNTLKDGETAIGYQIGFDRQAAQQAPIYLRLLQATIEDGIALGCTRLSLGRTALEPKSRLGARPETMHIWLRHRLPTMNLLLKGIVGHLPHAEAPERNPFK